MIVTKKWFKLTASTNTLCIKQLGNRVTARYQFSKIFTRFITKNIIIGLTNHSIGFSCINWIYNLLSFFKNTTSLNTSSVGPKVLVSYRLLEAKQIIGMYNINKAEEWLIASLGLKKIKNNNKYTEHLFYPIYHMVDYL